MTDRIASPGNNLDAGGEKSVEMLTPKEPIVNSQKAKAFALAFVVVGGIVWGVLRDEEGVIHVFRERSRLQDLGRSVAGLREENNRLRDDIRALREDPRAVERVAREDLGLSRDGEIVFILEGESGDEGR